MKFTIRPKVTDAQAHRGHMSATAIGAREALNIVKQMTADGRIDVEILDEKGRPYDLVELERLAKSSDDA